MDATQNNSNGKADLSNFLDQEDFNVEFKPLTSGLGFKNGDDLKHDLLQQKALNSFKAKQKTEPLAPKVSEAKDFGELAPFYDETANIPRPITEASLNRVNIEEKTMPEEEHYIERELKEASIFLRGLAHLIDISIVLFFTSLTALLILYIGALNLNELTGLGLIDEGMLFAGTLFILFYFCYFTFSDSSKNSSLGKSAVGLLLLEKNGARPNVRSTFFRSFITILSYPLFCLPLMAGLQDKLSGTIVTESYE